MFRLDGLPPVDPLEEKKKIKKATQESVLMFFFMCAAIRIAPLLLRRISESS